MDYLQIFRWVHFDCTAFISFGGVLCFYFAILNFLFVLWFLS